VQPGRFTPRLHVGIPSLLVLSRMRQPDIHSRARPITRADARAVATCACDVNGSQIGSSRDCRIVPRGEAW
jgi:hypothetical protein